LTNAIRAAPLQPPVARAWLVMPKIDRELLSSHNVCKQRPRPGESKEAFLARQTHLSLNNQRVKAIENLHLCPLLQVCYLFDNSIETLTNVASLSHLTHLYLQNNQISRVEDLSALRRLTKLYLNGNALSSLAPFGCLGATLQELHVCSQQSSSGQPLNLAPPVLPQLRCLRVIALANNGLSDASPLAALTKLEKVDLAKNHLPDVQSLKALLEGAPRLQELDLRDNPISASRQMLDAVIVHGSSLETLNARELIASERQYLAQLHRRGARNLDALSASSVSVV